MQQQFGKLSGGGVNLGYIRDWWLVDVRQVLNLPKPRSGSNGKLPLGAVQLAESTLPTGFAFAPKAASMTEGSETGIDGTAYALTLAATIPKPDAQLLGWLERSGTARWVVIWRDFNNMVWVGGERGNGLRLTWTRQNIAPNNLTLTLSGRSWHPAWQIDATDIDAVFPVAHFTSEFDNLDFMS